MGRTHDVVVVGGGMAGLATAWALARDRRDVLVLERFSLGHDRGSSHGTSRIFRLSHDDPEDVRRAQRALELWRELEAESGERLLHTNGLLELRTDVSLVVDALEACGVPYELPGRDEVRTRFGVEPPSGLDAVSQLDGGIVLADRALAAFARSAGAHGATIVEERAASRVELVPDGVVVDGHRARAAVIAAGSWAKGLLAPLGIELPVEVSRETVAYFRLRETRMVPSVIEWDSEAASGAYLLEAPGLGVKAGLHRSGPTVDPDEPGPPSEEQTRWIAGWVQERLPTADPLPVVAEACLYTSTSDERFVIERHGEVVVASACSGRGFKFAPLTGRRAADLVTEVL